MGTSYSFVVGAVVGQQQRLKIYVHCKCQTIATHTLHTHTPHTHSLTYTPHTHTTTDIAVKYVYVYAPATYAQEFSIFLSNSKLHSG